MGIDVGWPTWVLSNHDNGRLRTRYGGSEAKPRAAAVLLLTLRGTPFMYQGEELGLDDADVPPDCRVDPGGRDGPRAPWTRASPHGWTGRTPWLPFPPEPHRRSVEAQRQDPSSMLRLYRRLLARRRDSPALQVGRWQRLDGPTDVLAYRRDAGSDSGLVAVNFADEARSLPVDGSWVIEVDSAGSEGGAPFAGWLEPEQALIIRPGNG